MEHMEFEMQDCYSAKMVFIIVLVRIVMTVNMVKD